MKNSARFRGALMASLLPFFSLTVNAQWSSSTGQVFLTNSSDNVGIGTTPTGFKLDVRGDINMTNGAALRIGGIKILSYQPGSIYGLYLGEDAGRFNTTGQVNTFLGTSAGASNTTGSNNTFVGGSAGASTDIGYFNTMVGAGCGVTNVNGSFNTYTGTAAARYGTGSNNCAYGANALHSLQYGDGNSVFGSSAGQGNGTPSGSGSKNTLIGVHAGYYLRDGWYNVVLGADAGTSFNVRDENYNTFIGAQTAGDGSSNTFLGFNAHGTGTLTNSAAFGANAEVNTSNTMVLGDLSTTVVIGNIGQTGSSYELEVYGEAYLSSGTLWLTSDQRFKKDIHPYNGAMGIINKLNPVEYFYNTDQYPSRKFSDRQQIGFIAQELEQVLPDMVKTNADGYKAVNYYPLFGVLTQGLKEQYTDLSNTKKEMDVLKAENQQLSSELAELKQRLDAMENGKITGTGTASDNTQGQPTAKLEQNEPNPFTESTTLRYFVPQGTQGAKIIIRSENTTEVTTFDIQYTGHGSLVVSGNTLKPGIYTSELYINGKLVDMKKMLMVK